MSWHFSQALVAEYSAAFSLAGELSALSSSTSTPATASSKGKTTDASPRSPSGTMFALSTDGHGGAVLTWFRAASRARTSVALDVGPALTEPEAVFGLKCSGSFARWNPVSSSWKTPQLSLLGGLDVFSETWPRSGSMRSGWCWERTTLERRTDESESGFWPTPRAANPGSRPNGKGGKVLDEEVKIAEGLRLRGEKLWPTPTVCGNYNRKGASATSGDGLATAVRTWPTPQASDNRDRGNISNPSIQRRIAMGKQIGLSMPVKEDATGGSLNPNWVEWLMGWPIGWTDCGASATDKFHLWRQQHFQS